MSVSCEQIESPYTHVHRDDLNKLRSFFGCHYKCVRGMRIRIALLVLKIYNIVNIYHGVCVF